MIYNVELYKRKQTLLDALEIVHYAYMEKCDPSSFRLLGFYNCLKCSLLLRIRSRLYDQLDEKLGVNDEHS